MDGERTYMKFEKVVIKNFRNFDNVELDLMMWGKQISCTLYDRYLIKIFVNKTF